MAVTLGYESPEALIDAVVPEAIRRRVPMDLPGPQREVDVLARLREFAGRNRVCRSFIGMGYYGTHTPAVIRRNVLENPGWYTAYTPYQAEISQGRLEALLTYQQLVMDLTGMDLANASMLDEATAAAEAMTLLKRVNKGSKSPRFLVDGDCHPQTLAVLETRARPLGIEIATGEAARLLDEGDGFGLFLQYPASSGRLSDPSPLIERAHRQGTRVAVASDLLALLMLRSPGDLGADVVVGSSQRFGVPMGYGGPHAAFFATRAAYKRSTPGRIIGVSVDRHGRPALRMALQTREQHIRREKASSNICTAQALLAVMAAFYAMYHGPRGLRRIAERSHRLTCMLAAALESGGLRLAHRQFFDTLSIEPGDRRARILERAEVAGINLRRDRDERLGVSLDETTTRADLAALLRVFGVEGARLDFDDPDFDEHGLDKHGLDDPGLDEHGARAIPEALARPLDYLQHPLFNEYHSETEMLRYLRRLEHKDIALNRRMIPLGSCTMKLNATTEMLPVTWEGFAELHPFAPGGQTAGYRDLLADLERRLLQCTGYDALSLQPNAGSQGEYAGLLAIKRYHESRGEARRNICLIPSSAHGTNPASAVLAGLRVVIVECDERGNVDVDDLRARAARHSAHLAALMVTYPSTHGVFEEGIAEVCAIVHAHGGQVYVDGANLNALIGLAAPGHFGADVSHLNLHKTFCIPHGGGGPGMGPIGVGAHLKPFLPAHPLSLAGEPARNTAESARNTAESARNTGESARNRDVVSATPYGSASILPISWAYIALMGGEGLTQASRVAILSANYIAHRLRPHYPVLYTGQAGAVAHECIIDIRPIKEASGIGEEDIAKRLMDFGFHAPTMSFPVPGTLMIEPTESESLAELDRFCAAMITIRHEIQAVQEGRWPRDNNPLVNAPHTLRDLAAEHWPYAYSREQAAFAMDSLKEDKYWPPVNRVDNVYGDRNLFCACPSIDSFRDRQGAAPASG